MRALLLGKAEKAKIADLVKLAHENPLTPAFLAKLSDGFDPEDPASRSKLQSVIPLEFTIDIPHGFRVTYTEEQQPCGLCRHLSVSVPGTDRVPNPVAIQMLLTLFGFERVLGDRQMVYPEKYGSGLTSINVIEPMEMADAT